MGVSTLQQQYADPELANAGGNTYPIKWSVGEGLVYQDLKTNYVPGLAERWELSADKLTWTFHLRKNVKMHDGSTFTARDVKTAIDRVTDAPEWASYAAFKAQLAFVNVVDDLTIEITSKAPYANLPQDTPAPIATAYYKKVGEAAFRKKPMAAGPFKFVSQKLNTSMTLERFDDFWDKKRVPNFKTLVFKIIPDESTRVAALRTGQIDIAQNIGATSANQLKGTSGVKLHETPTANQATIYFPDNWSGKKTPLKDPQVRKALLLAIDREAIAKSLYKGYASVPNNLTLPTTAGADQSLKPYPFDPEEAKKLLADAGASDLEFTMHTYSQTTAIPDVQQLLQAVVGYWEKVGVKAKLVVVDPATYLAKAASHKYDGGQIIANPGLLASDPVNFSIFYASNGGYSAVKDPGLDRLFTELAAAVDPAAKDQLAGELSRNLHENMWALPVLNLTTVLATGPKIAGYKLQDGNPYPGPFTGVSVR